MRAALGEIAAGSTAAAKRLQCEQDRQGSRRSREARHALPADHPSSLSFTTLPPWVRRMALPISSSRIGLPCSLSQKAERKLNRLRANSAEASAARREGTFLCPTIFPPCFSTISPATAPSTLPPASTARSTI